MSDVHFGDNVTMLGGNHNIGISRGPAAEPPAQPGTTPLVWADPLIFVNYRHMDEKAAADIEAELTRQLGSGAVFRDARMPAGTEFPQELTDRAISCKVMVAVIGERWDDDNGLRLLSDESDWVRREIGIALEHGVQVVPVMVGARGRLAAGGLPEDIRMIAYLRAPHLRRGYDTHDVRRLVGELLRDVRVR